MNLSTLLAATVLSYHQLEENCSVQQGVSTHDKLDGDGPGRRFSSSRHVKAESKERCSPRPWQHLERYEKVKREEKVKKEEEKKEAEKD